MVICDLTLPNTPAVIFGASRRFSDRPASSGCGLPMASLLEAENGKVVSLRGTFPLASRRTAAFSAARLQCSEAYYSVPNLLKESQPTSTSHGVVVTEPRFRYAGGAGQDSPGPIFNIGNMIPPSGGHFSQAARFSSDRPPRPRVRADSLAAAREQMSINYESSRNVSGSLLERPSSSKATCFFGQRLQNSFSPFRQPLTLVHTHARDGGALETHHIVGGAITRAVRRLPSEIIAARDPTPGPGHFTVKSEIGSGASYIGRRLREAKSSTPGPCSYDVSKADERLRRKRR